MANEYFVNSSDLSSVANAIRGKTGSNASLAFPDGFVSSINAIQTSSPSQILMAAGSITPSASTKTLTITHNLGQKPNFFVIYLDVSSTSTLGTMSGTLQEYIVSGRSATNLTVLGRVTGVSSSGSPYSLVATSYDRFTTTESDITFNIMGMSGAIFQPYKYIWFAVYNPDISTIG